MPQIQPDNPLNGVTLEQVLNELLVCYGWNPMFFQDSKSGAILRFFWRLE
jgi:uncharacterized protein (DUF2132 family)